MSAIAPAFINAAAIFPQIGASIRQCSSVGQGTQDPTVREGRRHQEEDGSSSRREGGEGDRWGLWWWCATTARGGAGVGGSLPLPPALGSPTWQLGRQIAGAAAFCQCAMPMPSLLAPWIGPRAALPCHHPMCARVSGGVCAVGPCSARWRGGGEGGWCWWGCRRAAPRPCGATPRLGREEREHGCGCRACSTGIFHTVLGSPWSSVPTSCAAVVHSSPALVIK